MFLPLTALDSTRENLLQAGCCASGSRVELFHFVCNIAGNCPRATLSKKPRDARRPPLVRA